MYTLSVEADVLIGYEMNGRALTAEQGFPARLVVPGFYGTNSVKWLTRMTLAEKRAPGPFTTRWYNDPILDGAGRETPQRTPVWSIAPESLIVSPAPNETIEGSTEREIWAWRRAALEPPRDRERQRFSISWTPGERGSVLLA